MTRIKTPLSGITTTSTYEEGSMYSLVNLRPKNGALHPVAPRKVIQELSQDYDIVFVHQNNDYKNWIGVKSDNNYSSIYWDILSEHPKTIASYLQTKIHSVEQIGNTLSFVTDSNIYYAWYTNGNYVYLDEIPQVPVIGLKTYSQAHAQYYFANEYSSGTIKPENFIDATKGLVNKAMDALVNGWTDKDGVWHDGLGLMLFDAHFVRYAFRLYDGTLTKHSPPILLMPARHIVGSEEEGSLDSIKSISYDFDSTLRNGSFVDVYGHTLALDYDLTQIGRDYYTKWEDIIKSVDIFMSAPLGISNIENIRKDMPTTDSPRTLNYNLIKGLSPEALKTVSNTSTFYLIRSIPLGTSRHILDPEEFPSTEADVSKLENLIFQEVMTDDNFSNHKYGAACSYAYNNRLQLANIRTTFFKGFNPDYFLFLNTADKEDGNYNGFKYADAPGEKFESLLFEVEINTGLTNEKVYSYIQQGSMWGIYKMFMSGFISYPDPRAKRLTIYRYSGSQWYQVFSQPLEKHNLLSLAFFVSDDLKPIVEIEDLRAVTLPDTSKTISLTEPNKIKVSELNNPLSFPNLNTYQAGNGTILAMATNAMNVSDRNYGQYPLYLFTTQGIWTLNVGEGEAVYSSQTAPTYTEAPTTDIVCSTPFGVVFTTQRGLQIINGQSVDFLSPQLEQPFKRMEEETNPQIEELLHKFEKQRFSDYLKGLKNIIYNSYENELIINNPTSSFNYVLGLYNRQFYQSTEKISNDVKNIFPELIVVDRNNLKDYSEIETTRTHFSLMLRPLTFGNELTKWFSNLKIPFTLYDVERMFVGVYASADGVRFVGRYGNFYREMDRAVAYNTKTMASNNGRYFLVALAAIASCESYLDIIDPEVSVKYNNM